LRTLDAVREQYAQNIRKNSNHESTTFRKTGGSGERRRTSAVD
jgi:hypothetical protein